MHALEIQMGLVFPVRSRKLGGISKFLHALENFSKVKHGPLTFLCSVVLAAKQV